ncbi:MAG: sensor histidine kinase [Tissierella sp.]|uniref:sensor histidine kinase n=1 Tax=Tissierella sp. TaxID=41274 RepID=UPI003F97F284
MKIKRWLIISYILVILSPILTGTLLFNWIRTYDREIQVQTYLENINRFSEYEKKLEDPKLYLDYKGKYELINEKDKDHVQINLYNRYGYNLYSSGLETLDYRLDKKVLYKDFYNMKTGYRADKLKKPVFLNNELVGVYEITLNKNDFVEEVNKRTIVAIGLFMGNFILVLFIVIRMINKKINNPLEGLIFSMKNFALGKNERIDYQSQDEIGELIHQFNLMKNEIEEKDINLEREKASKEHMISAISHDLKTPLTSIRAYTEIIKSDKDEKDTKKYEDIIIGKCDYMKDMLENLQYYTLLTSDYKMDFVKVEGEEFFQMILSGYGDICKKNNLNYSEEILIDGSLKIDVNSMIRVMDNLITNAIKYSEKGGHIFVGVYSSNYNLGENLDEETRKELENFRGEDSLVIVKNTGKTIGKDELKTIFEPFYKADNSRKNIKKDGTGLGLSIVKSIIDKHGGRIKVLSEDNTTLLAYTIKGEKN